MPKLDRYERFPGEKDAVLRLPKLKNSSCKKYSKSTVPIPSYISLSDVSVV